MLLAALTLFTMQAPARAEAPRLADDAIAAIQDGMIQWLDMLLGWAGISEFDLVGFRLTPTDDPTIWKGGFIIREEGCAEDRMIDADWHYIDNEEERAVATSAVVTRRCDGSDRQVTLMIKQGLGFVDGEAPRYTTASGAYAPEDAAACAHSTTVAMTADGSALASLSILNGCDGTTSLFNCNANWCSGPDLLTHVQISADDEYTVHRLARKYVYKRVLDR
jgi:hypothetical protein